MREIKFRAWDKRFNQMADVHAIALHQNILILSTRSDRDTPFSEVNLMQFTGLKDKNGKEIYEGDIFENHQADINIVNWFGGSWCYENYHAGALPLWPDNETCEVLGNIYENPELLND